MGTGRFGRPDGSGGPGGGAGPRPWWRSVAPPALAAAPTVTAQEQPAGKLTLTVGIVNDVDSLNPFIGILAESYEVWC